MYRQGDILIFPVAEIPTNIVPVERDKQGRLVLAEGEVTGHFHCILDDPATLFRQADVDEMADRFLSVEAEAALTHDEHATITLPPGQYRVRRQREFAPEAPVYVTD